MIGSKLVIATCAAAAAAGLATTSVAATPVPGAAQGGSQSGAAGGGSSTIGAGVRFKSGTKYWRLDARQDGTQGSLSVHFGRDKLKGTTKTQGDFNLSQHVGRDLSHHFSVEIDG